MTPVNLVIFWHMHQPQYRDPATGEYILPWTRLHALKDYWGMVHMLEEFPGVHATFNMVPSLALQLEEYASGKFREPWFDAAFAPAAELSAAMREEILTRAFQANHQNMIYRWPRFGALFEEARAAGAAAMERFNPRDWRDLQVLSQLAWMDEEYLAGDAVTAALSAKGAEFSEEDKAALKERQLHLLGEVIPEYRRARERGQIEISTTPFYHPILPLVCDTEIARVSNPHTPLPRPAFAYPEDARTQLECAREYHARLFGHAPKGLWPSEGSVSDAALDIAIELGFEWFATDEGILGGTRREGFARDGAGMPENAADLYSAWTLERPAGKIRGLFRDHYLSDLVGFIYSRMPAEDAAADLHRRIRFVGENWSAPQPPIVSLILDGENAWEHFPGNGREFLRRFYGRLQNDAEIRAVTVSEAIGSAHTAEGGTRSLSTIYPGSWINANFDVWIGDAEDVRAWELLGDARRVYGRKAAAAKEGAKAAVSAEQLARAFESILAAEGSDWCWWYGPENSTANDADFDALYRKHLAGVYLALGEAVPDALSRPIGRILAPAQTTAPSSFVDVTVDGRETSFFEWLGAGSYVAQRHGGAMHGRTWIFGELRFGFSAEAMFLRIEPAGRSFPAAKDAEIRILATAGREVRVTLEMSDGELMGWRTLGSDGAEGGRREGATREGETREGGAREGATRAGGTRENDPLVSAALGKILEVRLGRGLFGAEIGERMLLAISYWQAGIPLDFLPAHGALEIEAGEAAFGWSPSP